MNEREPSLDKAWDFYESDLEEWIRNPITVLLMEDVAKRSTYNQEMLVRGNIADLNRGEQRFVYRSNEALRGGLIELSYIAAFPNLLAEELKEQKKEKEAMQETTEEDLSNFEELIRNLEEDDDDQN